MDVFNSALRNPLPPLRKKSDRRRSTASGQLPVVAPAEASSLEEEVRKKKNSRRKHRNSHLGCGTCKKRRIKCDENLPQCFNCVKGKLQCAYLNLDAPARNALRMAQYNQNLRQDRHEDGGSESAKDAESGDEAFKDPSARTPSVHVDPYYPGYVPYLVPPGTGPAPSGANGSPVAMATPIQAAGQQVGHHPGASQPPVGGPGAPAYIQSPYGSIVQFQHVPAIPGYPPVAVQVMQGPQGPQVVYQNPEQMVQYPPQMHMTPANIDGQPVLLMQNTQLDRNGPYDSGALGAHPQGFVQPTIQVSRVPLVPLVPSHPAALAGPPSYGAPAGQYLASVPLPPPPPAQMGAALASSAPTSAKDILPPLGALSNPSSIKTSPQLPIIQSVVSGQLAGPDYEQKTEVDFKLPPIKSDVISSSNSTSTSPNVADKVPSILKLLS